MLTAHFGHDVCQRARTTTVYVHVNVYGEKQDFQRYHKCVALISAEFSHSSATEPNITTEYCTHPPYLLAGVINYETQQ